MHSARTSPARGAPDLEIWRRTLHVSDLFRIVAKKGADSERMNRITVNQARIFGYIFSRNGGDPIRISTLAHDLDVTSAAAGQAVDRLVRDGMVDRKTDPTDRRAFVIDISAKGRDLLREHEDRCRALSNELLADLPAEDVATFDRVLSVLYDGLYTKWREFLAARDDAKAVPPPVSTPL